MAKHRPTARAVGGPIGAVVALIAISVGRFVWPDANGTMWLAVVPIALLGIMLGFRAGLLAALFASAVALTWVVTEGEATPLQLITYPLNFFILGGITGYYAKGALGDFDLRRARTCAHVRHAIDRGEIRLHYQPIMRTGGELYAVEALARWQDPGRGMIPPLEFIPECEGDDHTMWELTLHTLRQAVQDSRILGDGVTVAVNLSPVSLRRLELPEAIDEVIGDVGLQTGRIAIEVTESAISSDDEMRVVEVLGQLKRAGVTMVAVDDFGIGHSSLARLGRLPIDTVKIDRTLIADSERPETAAVIRGMIELAHAVNLTVVAEGVEDARTWDWLVKARCDAIQGFKLSRPMPPEELPGWLEAYEGGASLTPA
jgi:EAL domain-containing protein (putative c-di-GMP-specific phosphodiesterase class I)